MSRYSGYDSGRSSWVMPTVSVTVVLAAIAGIWWFVFGYYADITARQWKWFTQMFVERGFMPDGLDVTQWTPWAYLLLGIFAAVAAYFLFDWKEVVAYAAGAIAAALVITSVVTWAHNVNDHSAAYADGTVFVVSDLDDMPDSLKRLADKATVSSKECAMLADQGMRGCIAEGEMNFTWEARTSSLVGATKRIKTASSGNNKTQLLEDTLTYVYGAEGEGSWTAIRDGKSKQPIYGVLSYNGKTDPTICEFEGENALDKAFNGRWGHNLSDEIADKYPNLFFDGSDRYGFCDGDKPVIVIPVKEQIPFHHRTAFRSAGVLVITGSPSGVAVYQHVTDVKPGDFPGPVYPASLAKEQRESMGMIAGIRNSLFNSFGYEPVDEDSQDGNVSEYLLRDTVSGRIFWVTPLKQRDGDNQRIVAYSVVPADSASSGELNQQQVFVLNDNDPRVASISDMEASVRQRLSEDHPGFYTADGYLAEFLPLDDKTWQVYAEIKGRVVYRVVVPVDTDIRPTIFEVNPIDEEEGELTLSACVEDLDTLDDKQLVRCLSDIADELESRQDS